VSFPHNLIYGSTLGRLQDHIDGLLLKHGIGLLRARNFRDYQCFLVEREIKIMPITTKDRYMCALHEIGHLVDAEAIQAWRDLESWIRNNPQAEFELVFFGRYHPQIKTTMMTMEARAWIWAIENAKPDGFTTHPIQVAFGTYVRDVGVRVPATAQLESKVGPISPVPMGLSADDFLR
jgi:hypothetical protein